MTAITGVEAGLILFVLATAVVTALFRDVLASIVVFAAYSLGLAALYTFYRAPDVSLTEAAIGAGVTTVLLLLTIAKTSRPVHDDIFEDVDWVAVGAVSVLGAVLLSTLFAFPAVGEVNAITGNEEVSGYYLEHAYKDTHVENTVTSVLAAYRGFDTFGEAVVVFAAGVATMLVLGREAFA